MKQFWTNLSLGKKILVAGILLLILVTLSNFNSHDYTENDILMYQRSTGLSREHAIKHLNELEEAVRKHNSQ